MHIRIGTRTSLMAMAQTRRVAAALRAKHPGLTTELVGIMSTGDRDKTTPLWQMDATGVFSRELDERLLVGEVDCTVHSLKDLGTQRPEGITTVAITARDDIRDVILFRADILDRLRDGKPIKIGSSAPRRIQLLPPFLTKALPQLSETPIDVRCESLRGNAHSRIARLHRPREGKDDLDGVVLALGGLERLFSDDEGRTVLEPLLEGLKRMIVPLTVCPAAPGQGVVAVEALEGRTDVADLFKVLHHDVTARDVAAEREILVRHGGGCHQKFGASQVHLPNLGQDLLIVRGCTKEDAPIDDDVWGAPAAMPGAVLFDGQASGKDLLTAAPLDFEPVSTEAAFVANARAMPEKITARHIWVPGPSTWFKLAARGIWVEGSADGFGFDFVRETVTRPMLGLPPLSDWAIYTHEAAATDWAEGHVVSTYRLEPVENPAALAALGAADIAWWGSASQHAALAAHAGHIRLHACGAGKTAEALKSAGLSPLAIFPDHNAFLRWFHAGRNV